MIFILKNIIYEKIDGALTPHQSKIEKKMVL